ncbi:MAG: 4-hydroxy-tetrahydrodipicolinate synthase [Bacilli bacterium]
MRPFGSLVTAMVTPFDEAGEVCLERTTALVEHLIETGSTALVVCGTTGESPTLTKEEKLTLIAHVVKVVNGRVPVIAGTGSNCTRSSIAMTKEAESLGVDAVMLVVPYYNKPSQRGMYAHFKAIAESTPLPIMLYNIPGRSVVNMLPDTVVALSEIPNIICVKEASGNLGQMTDIIARTADDFAVYSGDDGLTLPLLAIGGAGVVSVSAHVIGEEMADMIAAFDAGEHAKAAHLHSHVSRVTDVLFMAPNPTAVKAVLNHRGIEVGSVRLPLVPLTDDELDTVLETTDAPFARA